MALTLAPSPWFTGLDNNGNPISGGKLYTYAAGTTTPLATYADADMITANANPIILDSSGRATIYLLPSAYKFTLNTSADVLVRTQDDIDAVAASTVNTDIQGTAGETLVAGEAVYLSDGTGGLTAGRWYKTDADNTYSSVSAQALGFAVANIASAASGTIRRTGRITDLAGLTAGTVYYVSATAGAITSSAPTNSKPVGVADSSTSLVISFDFTPVLATTSTAGLVSATSQIIPGAKTFDSQPSFYVGSGGASATAKTSGTLNVNTTPVGNVGAGEDTLMSYTLPANTLATDAQVILIYARGFFANNANNKRLKIHFGATSISIHDTTTANAYWTVEFNVFRTGAATQIMSTKYFAFGANGTTIAGFATPAETLSGAVVIKLTGEATATDDIIQQEMIIETLN